MQLWLQIVDGGLQRRSTPFWHCSQSPSHCEHVPTNGDSGSCVGGAAPSRQLSAPTRQSQDGTATRTKSPACASSAISANECTFVFPGSPVFKAEFSAQLFAKQWHGRPGANVPSAFEYSGLCANWLLSNGGSPFEVSQASVRKECRWDRQQSSTNDSENLILALTEFEEGAGAHRLASERSVAVVECKRPIAQAHPVLHSLMFQKETDNNKSRKHHFTLQIVTLPQPSASRPSLTIFTSPSW